MLLKNTIIKNNIFDDGVFEVTLFKTPKNPVELNELIGAVVMRQINSDRIYSFKSGEVRFESVETIPWTLDGEYGGTHEEVVIKNKNQALQIMVKEEAVEDLSEQLVEADEV